MIDIEEDSMMEGSVVTEREGGGGHDMRMVQDSDLNFASSITGYSKQLQAMSARFSEQPRNHPSLHTFLTPPPEMFSFMN